MSHNLISFNEMNNKEQNIVNYFSLRYNFITLNIILNRENIEERKPVALEIQGIGLQTIISFIPP